MLFFVGLALGMVIGSSLTALAFVVADNWSKGKHPDDSALTSASVSRGQRAASWQSWPSPQPQLE